MPKRALPHQGCPVAEGLAHFDSAQTPDQQVCREAMVLGQQTLCTEKKIGSAHSVPSDHERISDASKLPLWNVKPYNFSRDFNKHIWDIRMEMDLLNKMQKLQTMKEKMVKSDCIKIKSICVTDPMVKGKVTVTISDLLLGGQECGESPL